VTASGLAVAQRDLIVSLAARHKLPAVYNYRGYVASGGLISYGADLANQFRLAAGYADRILKGEKPADLPVQAPSKIRAGDQQKHCQGACPQPAVDIASPRRRDDRITSVFTRTPP
jgi:hypothetical protein